VNLAQYLPYIDVQGQIISYVPDRSATQPMPHAAASNSMASQEAVLYQRDPSGVYIPVAATTGHTNLARAQGVDSSSKLPPPPPSQSYVHDFTKVPELDMSDPAPLTQFTPLNPQPLSNSPRSLGQGVSFTSLELLGGGGWDSWANGPFILDLNHAQYEITKKLELHWVTKTNGGDKRGSVSSPDVQGGRISNKQCLGVIRCRNDACKILVRPKVRSADIRRQLAEKCQCGSSLVSHSCGSKSFLIQWGRSGDDDTTIRYRYLNGSAHNHPRIPQVKHFSQKEYTEFEKLVHSHPKLGPAGLLVGPQVVGGYGRGAADIGQAGKNRAFVAYKAREIKSRSIAQNGHWFIEQFSHWQRSHPGIVRTSLFHAEVSIISVQTGWMCNMLLPEIAIVDKPVRGLITDGAHGYWSEGRAILIVTSIFCASLGVWVPGLFTYADGASTRHYRYHFKGVFESIGNVAQARNVEVTDEMFIMVWNLIFGFFFCPY
jgi:hypothetical protein